MLLNRSEAYKILEIDDKLIRKFEPAYMVPTSTIGRAHFYSPVKKLGNLTIDTLWFNVIFIWITTLIFYLLLYFDVLKKVITRFENIHWRKAS